MKRNLLKVFIGVSALALTMSACSGNVDDIKSMIQSAISNYSSADQPSDGQQSQNVGDSSKSSDAPISSDSSNPTSLSSSSGKTNDSSSQGGQGGTSSQSQPGDKYQVSEDFWNANIQQSGFFGKNSNITFIGETKEGGKKVSEVLVEVNNGDVHFKGFEEEFYLDMLDDNSLDYYEIDYETGKWKKDNIPAAVSASFSHIFIEVIQPYTFSDFTYNPSTHAYEKQIFEFHPNALQPDYKVTLKNIKFRFENNKFLSYEYDAYTPDGEGSGIVKGSKWGTTSFAFPVIGSQGGEPHGGEGEDPTEIDNPFCGLVFKFDGIRNFNALESGVTEAQMIEKYKTARLSTFPDGTGENNTVSNCSYEMSYVENGVTYALLGKFSANATTANFVARVSYDSASREYNSYLKDEIKYLSMTYDAKAVAYYLHFIDIDNQGKLMATFDIVLGVESNQPVHLDLPQEPISDNYTVTYDQWKDIFENHKLLNGTSNFTMISKDNAYGFETVKTFMADSGKLYIKQDSAYGSSEQYYSAKNTDLTEFTYYYFNPTDEIWVSQDAPFDSVSFFDSDLGLLPFKFADFTYNENTNYYYCSKYSHEIYEGYSEEITKIYIYFDGGKLQKIEYTDSIQQKHTFLYTNYGKTVVELPETGSTNYEDNFANKLYEYNRVTSSSAAFDTSKFEALSGSHIALFNKNDDGIFPAEFFMTNGVLMGGNSSVTVTGEFEAHKDSYTSQLYVILHAKQEIYDGLVEESDLGTMKVYYDADTQELYIKESGMGFYDAAGQRQETSLCLYFKLSSKAPEHVVVPELPNAWDSAAVVNALDALEVTSGTIPALSGVKEFNVAANNDGFAITCVMPSAAVASKMYDKYLSGLNKDYIKVYNEDYSSVIGYQPSSTQFQFSIALTDATISFSVIKLESILPISYPNDAITAFLDLNKITDSVPSFAKVAGSQGFMFYSEEGSNQGQLGVLVGDGEFAKAVASAKDIISKAGYTEKAVGNNMYYLSANGQLALHILTYSGLETFFYIEFLPGSAAETPKYPSDKISAYLKSINADGDAIPELPLPIENGYTFVEDSGGLYMIADATAVERAIGESARVLKQNGFTEEVVSGQTYYVSPNRISCIMFNSTLAVNEGEMYLMVMFGSASKLPMNSYPTAQIQKALSGVKDSVPDLGYEGAYYNYLPPFNEDSNSPEAVVDVMFDEQPDIEALLSAFDKLITGEDYGYKLCNYIAVSTKDEEPETYWFEGVYVSANKEVAIMMQQSDYGYTLSFINLKNLNIDEMDDGSVSIVGFEMIDYSDSWDLDCGEEYYFDGHGVVYYSDETEVEVYMDVVKMSIEGDTTQPGTITLNFQYTDEEGRSATTSITVELYKQEGGEEGGEEEEVTYTLHLVNYSTYRVTENRYLFTIINGDMYYIYGIDDIQEREAFELSGVPTDTRVLTIYCIDGSSDFDSTDASTFIDSTQVRIVSSGGAGGEIDPTAPIQLMMHFDKLPEYVEPQTEE